MSFSWLSPERRTASVIVRDNEQALSGAASRDNFSVIEQPSPQRESRRFQEMRQGLQDFRQQQENQQQQRSASSGSTSIQRPPSLPRPGTPVKTVVHADSQWARQQNFLSRPAPATASTHSDGVHTITLRSTTGNPNSAPKVVVENGGGDTIPNPAIAGLIRTEQEINRLMNETANAETVGRSLFEQRQAAQIHLGKSNGGAGGGETPSTTKRVVTEERPAWIGPMDAGGFETPGRNGGRSTPNRQHGTPTSRRRTATRTKSGGGRGDNKGKGGGKDDDEVHLLQDGRKVVFRGSTKDRLLEERLYTGQSKLRFAWKKDDVEGALHMAEYSGDDTTAEFAYGVEEILMRRQAQQQAAAAAAGASGGGGGTPSSAAGMKTPSGRSDAASTAGGTPGRVTPVASRRAPPDPALYLMKGTGLAAEQLRRAKTEGERRTAETLLRRQAWKALNPGALEWGDKKWTDTLRPATRSGRAGADNFDDAKNFAVYKKPRPQWRFPGPQGPTMQELREAPVVVNLSLEDLKVSGEEEEQLEMEFEKQQLLQKMYEDFNGGTGRRRGGSQSVSRSNSPRNAFPCRRDVSPRARSVSGGGTPALRPPSFGGAATGAGGTPSSVGGAGDLSGSAAMPPPPPTFTYGNQSFAASRTPSQHPVQYSGPIPVAAESRDFAVSREATGGAPVNKHWKASPVPITPHNLNIQQQQQQQFMLPSKAHQLAVSTFGAPNRSVHDLRPEDNPVRMRLDDSSVERGWTDSDTEEQQPEQQQQQQQQTPSLQKSATATPVGGASAESVASVDPAKDPRFANL